MRDHTKLRAFELADEVVLLIYRATREFPKEDRKLKAFSLQPKQPEQLQVTKVS